MVLLAHGRVLAAGGLDSNDKPMDSSERYNPITNLWSAAMQCSRLGMHRIDRGQFRSSLALHSGRMILLAW